ncbi:hypothetical protein L484_011143 [Morus notabilis]|uniref:Uncharacterized protein n=1 Tax=Morus notabilis TaxID=981085 RepID=W9RKH0_9ROSA|nr:hypothetical protein L484_011143 [Morus notabilis]
MAAKIRQIFTIHKYSIGVFIPSLWYISILQVGYAEKVSNVWSKVAEDTSGYISSVFTFAALEVEEISGSKPAEVQN